MTRTIRQPMCAKWHASLVREPRKIARTMTTPPASRLRLAVAPDVRHPNSFQTTQDQRLCSKVRVIYEIQRKQERRHPKETTHQKTEILSPGTRKVAPSSSSNRLRALSAKQRARTCTIVLAIDLLIDSSTGFVRRRNPSQRRS